MKKYVVATPWISDDGPMVGYTVCLELISDNAIGECVGAALYFVRKKYPEYLNHSDFKVVVTFTDIVS